MMYTSNTSNASSGTEITTKGATIMALARCEICDNYFDESDIDWDTMLCTNCFIESLDEYNEED